MGRSSHNTRSRDARKRAKRLAKLERKRLAVDKRLNKERNAALKVRALELLDGKPPGDKNPMNRYRKLYITAQILPDFPGIGDRPYEQVFKQTLAVVSRVCDRYAPGGGLKPRNRSSPVVHANLNKAVDAMIDDATITGPAALRRVLLAGDVQKLGATSAKSLYHLAVPLVKARRAQDAARDAATAESQVKHHQTQVLRWQRYTRRIRKLAIRKAAKSWFKGRAAVRSKWAWFSSLLLRADRRWHDAVPPPSKFVRLHDAAIDVPVPELETPEVFKESMRNLEIEPARYTTIGTNILLPYTHTAPKSST